MKNVFLFFLVLLFGCGNLQIPEGRQDLCYKELEFSYNDTWQSAFILKFTGGDTVYESRYFPFPKQLFRGILTEKEKSRIDSFMGGISFKRFHNSDHEYVMDGTSYGFYVRKASFARHIYVNGDDAPGVLRSFAICISQIRNRLKMISVDTIVDFRLATFFEPPPKPAVHYTVPHVPDF